MSSNLCQTIILLSIASRIYYNVLQNKRFIVKTRVQFIHMALILKQIIFHNIIYKHTSILQWSSKKYFERLFNHSLSCKYIRNRRDTKQFFTNYTTIR